MKKGVLQFLKVLGYMLGYFGAQLAVTFVIGVAYSIKLTGDMMAQGGKFDQITYMNQFMEGIFSKATWISLLSNLLCFAIIALVFLILKKQWYMEVNLKRFSVSYLPYLLLLGFALILMVNFGLELLPQSVLESYVEQSRIFGDDTSLIGIVAVVIVAPVFEEIFFRGLILSTLRKGIPTGWAIFLSAVVFGVAHGQILWMAYAFIIGLVFAYVAVKTGSIAASMVLHILFNFFGDVVGRFIPELPNGVNAILAAVGLIGAVVILMMLRNQQNAEEAAFDEHSLSEEGDLDAII